MRGRLLLFPVGILAAVVFVGCEEGSPRSASATADEVAAASPSPVASTPTPEARKPWRKSRFISIGEAVERLQAQVDVPVVLPSSKEAFLPNLKGWLADPKYLDWETIQGRRVGTMMLIKRNQLLILNYGLGQFDGCGGRETAIETTVLGEPALVKQTRKWSTVVWPVTPEGSTGRYGISGTFEGWQMVRLAESMEAAVSVEATDQAEGC